MIVFQQVGIPAHNCQQVINLLEDKDLVNTDIYQEIILCGGPLHLIFFPVHCIKTVVQIFTFSKAL